MTTRTQGAKPPPVDRQRVDHQVGLPRALHLERLRPGAQRATRALTTRIPTGNAENHVETHCSVKRRHRVIERLRIAGPLS
jgi:hypothetical protein